MNRQRIGAILAILVVAAVLAVAVKTASTFYADDPAAVDPTSTPSPGTKPDSTPSPSSSTSSPSPTTTRPGGPLAEQFGLPSSPVVVFVGDASTSGEGAKPKEGYAAQVARVLKWKASILPDGRGSGYLSRGSNFRQRVQRATPRDDVDLVVIAGSDADADAAPGDVAAALPDLLSAVRTTFKGAAVLVVGPFPTTPDESNIRNVGVSGPGLPGIDTALSRACSQAGVPYLSPLAGQWLTDDPRPFLTDDKNLDEAGHEEFAQHIEQAFG